MLALERRREVAAAIAKDGRLGDDRRHVDAWATLEFGPRKNLWPAEPRPNEMARAERRGARLVTRGGWTAPWRPATATPARATKAKDCETADGSGNGKDGTNRPRPVRKASFRVRRRPPRARCASVEGEGSLWRQVLKSGFLNS